MSIIPPIHPRKMCRILEQLGFEAIRQKGSHIFYRHPDGRGTVVPYHAGEELGSYHPRESAPLVSTPC